MNIEDAIRHYGSQAEMARKLGVTRGAVNQWRRWDSIPYPRQCQIEVETDGLLRAELTRATEISEEAA